MNGVIGDLLPAAIRRFVSDHGTAIMIAVLLLLGAKLLGDGIAAL